MTEHKLSEKELKSLMDLYSATLDIIHDCTSKAVEYKAKTESAKTSYKNQFYTEKFNRIKTKFQDELTRLLQIEAILKDHDISVKVRSPEDAEATVEVLEEEKQQP